MCKNPSSMKFGNIQSYQIAQLLLTKKWKIFVAHFFAPCEKHYSFHWCFCFTHTSYRFLPHSFLHSMTLVACFAKPPIVISSISIFQISDRGGGIPRSLTDRLFTYMYSTAPKPAASDINTVPLAGIYLLNVIFDQR